MTPDFYDDLAPLYHLIYRDWPTAIECQAEALDALIRREWEGRVTSILDRAAGIGTQALGLAARGYSLRATDLSASALARLEREAEARGLTIPTTVVDLRSTGSSEDVADLVLAWDNALPHLTSDEDLALALRSCFALTRPGGGCLFSIRDYEHESRTSPAMIAYGLRPTPSGRVAVYQVREWEGDEYALSFWFVEESDGPPKVHVAAGGRYRVVSVARVLELMRAAGYEDVRRLEDPEGAFPQPVLLGTRSSTSS